MVTASSRNILMTHAQARRSFLERVRTEMPCSRVDMIQVDDLLPNGNFKGRRSWQGVGWLMNHRSRANAALATRTQPLRCSTRQSVARNDLATEESLFPRPSSTATPQLWLALRISRSVSLAARSTGLSGTTGQLVREKHRPPLHFFASENSVAPRSYDTNARSIEPVSILPSID